MIWIRTLAFKFLWSSQQFCYSSQLYKWALHSHLTHRSLPSWQCRYIKPLRLLIIYKYSDWLAKWLCIRQCPWSISNTLLWGQCRGCFLAGLMLPLVLYVYTHICMYACKNVNLLQNFEIQFIYPWQEQLYLDQVCVWNEITKLLNFISKNIGSPYSASPCT